MLSDVTAPRRIIGKKKKPSMLLHIPCKHGKRMCKECTPRCKEHGKIFGLCSECPGWGKRMCEQHGKRKELCRQCNPTKFCTHGRRQCKECGFPLSVMNNISSEQRPLPTAVISDVPAERGDAPATTLQPQKKRKIPEPIEKCKHGKKYQCMHCEFISKCEHWKQPKSCTQCNPKLLCKHGKYKSMCMECKPELFCQHKKRRKFCTVCTPALICEHQKVKLACMECNKAKLMCEHQKRKTSCELCREKLMCTRHGNKKPTRTYHCKQCKAERAAARRKQALGAVVEDI